MMNPLSIITSLVKPVSAIFEKREERKKVVAEIKALTVQATAQGKVQVQMSDSAWELMSKKNEGDTWKDEFITVIMFAPFITMLLGALLSAFGYGQLMDATILMLKTIKDMELDYNTLLYATIGAGLGIKVWRG